MITALEALVLRNVRDGERLRGVTDANKEDHDATVMDLIERRLIAYNPRRKTNKFWLTTLGAAEVAAYERSNRLTLIGLAKEWS